MTTEDSRQPSRGAICVRALQSDPLFNGSAQGRPGRLGPVVRMQQKERGRTTGSAEQTRPSLRDGLRAYTAFPGATACRPPSPARSQQRRSKLDTSVGVSGPHGLAVRHILSRLRANAPDDMMAAAPRLHVRDDRETLLSMRRVRRKMPVISPEDTSDYSRAPIRHGASG
jgi:hypothetical protein